MCVQGAEEHIDHLESWWELNSDQTAKADWCIEYTPDLKPEWVCVSMLGEQEMGSINMPTVEWYIHNDNSLSKLHCLN